MKIYFNISNLMSKDVITCGDRLVLQFIIAVVKRGYEIVLFINDEKKQYRRVNNKMIADYFLCKRIDAKSLYIENEFVRISQMKSEDVYFEVDTLGDMPMDWKNYYEDIAKTECTRYSYIFLNTVLHDSVGNVEGRKKWRMWHIRYMNKIFVKDECMKELMQTDTDLKHQEIDILPLTKFVDHNVKDPLIHLDKGIRQIIKGSSYVCYLADSKDSRTQIGQVRTILDQYGEHKVIVCLLTCQIENDFLDGLCEDKNEQQRVWVIGDMDYYSLLNLYINATAVVVPRDNADEFQFEIENIRANGGQVILL